MPLRRPCLDCGRLSAVGKSRCDFHLKQYEARRTGHRKSVLSGVSTRLRAALNSWGYGTCAHCGKTYPASYIEVDHIKPIFKGGKDEERNLQFLCKPCHLTKSTEERRYG